jgi:ribulose-phosphate 3-epimerase
MALIAPSILSADFSRLGEAVRLAEGAGADVIHVDIMDGHFVPNLTLGPQLVAAIRKDTRLPIDVHLMVENPRAFVPLFREAGADWISLHVEATVHLHKDLSLIRSLGAKAGAALNPATPLDTLEEVWSELDYILIMSVNPGWGGQSFIPSCRAKIRRLRDRIRALDRPILIEVDGGLKLDNVEDILRAGMDVVVAGSAVYDAPDPAGAIRALKEIARKTP